MSDPSNLYALEDLRIISGYQITPVVATEDEIRNMQAKLFATGERITKILEEAAEAGAEDDVELDLGIAAGPDEKPIIRLVSSVLQHAVGDGASDIHRAPGARGDGPFQGGRSPEGGHVYPSQAPAQRNGQDQAVG